MKKKKRGPLWVIKAGSQMVVSGGPLLIREWMKQVHQLHEQYGIQSIWVSSGAIATARSQLNGSKALQRPGKDSLSRKQALSAIGQPKVFEQYNLALATQGRNAAQVLLTADDISNSNRRRNLKSTLDELLELGAVPILNENDTVATDEIEFGDNDRLSALVARLVGADRLIILTDVEGLLSFDPRLAKERGEAPKLLKSIPKVTLSVQKMATGHTSSGLGRGGMASKLFAAKEAARSAIPTHLVKGDLPSVLIALAGRDRTLWPGTFIGVQPEVGRPASTERSRRINQKPSKKRTRKV